MQQNQDNQLLGHQAPQPHETEYLVGQYVSEPARRQVTPSSNPVLGQITPTSVSAAHEHAHGSGSMWTQVRALLLKQYRMMLSRKV